MVYNSEFIACYLQEDAPTKTIDRARSSGELFLQRSQQIHRLKRSQSIDLGTSQGLKHRLIDGGERLLFCGNRSAIGAGPRRQLMRDLFFTLFMAAQNFSRPRDDF